MTDTTTMKPGEKIAYHVAQLQEAGVPWQALQQAAVYGGHMEILFREGTISVTGPGGGGGMAWALNLDDPFLTFEVGTQVLNCADDFGCVDAGVHRQNWNRVLKRIRDAEKRGVFKLED